MENLMIKRMLLALESLGSVVITDAEGRYIYVSPQRLLNGGFQESELLGKRVREIYPDTMVDEVIQSKRALLMRPMLAHTPNGPLQSFVSYYPLIDNGVCLGCFLYTSFWGMNSAMEFAHIVTELSKQLKQTKKQLQSLQRLSANYTSTDIIGQSHAINELKMEISMVSRTSSNVLIQGETGTGKELVAHSIHNLSARRVAPFIRVNCSAIPENLMESEFFGYEEGAFTGARKGGQPGKFERASGGSLFLDEINTLPMCMQPKFLRVLQEGEVERVGGSAMLPIDTRIITATNTPLEELVLQGEFRKDLYYRLNVVNITIPPLRDRKEDIPLLVNMFISQKNVQLGLDIREIHPDVIKMLMEYDWPGNIRELQNVVERAMNYAYEGTLTPSHFRFFSTRIASASAAATFEQKKVEDDYPSIQEALRICNGNKKAAARYLGCARSTLYKKLKGDTCPPPAH